VSAHRLPTSLPLPRGARLSVGEIEGEPHLVVSFEPRRPRLPTSLSAAEEAVAHLILAGASNDEIAHARGRSLPTIAKQIASLFRKLRVHSRAELVARLGQDDPEMEDRSLLTPPREAAESARSPARSRAAGPK
jgi:DNA-binding CsgD family transcriptional regulator